MTVSRPVGARHVRFAPPRVHVFALVVVVVVAVAYVALTCSLADAASVGGPVTVVHLATHGRRILVQKGLRLSSGNATALANHEYGAHGEHWGDEYHGTTQVVACTEEKHGVNATLLASISAAIRGAGVVAGYLPHDCVLATVTPEAAAILATVPGVAGVREVPAGKHRLSHEAARLVDALDAAAVARTDDLTSALPGWVKVVHPNTVGGNRTTAPLVALEVALPPASSQAKATNAAQAAVTSWTPRLRATTCPSCELTPRATPRGAAYVDVTTAAEHAADAIRWLSERPAAHLVSPQPADARVQNYHASAIVQNGGTALADSNYARPLWEVGIDGTGEIVGCGDSGIDVNSCFFRDNNGNEIGANHRKLVMYRALGDNVDGNGHGTHVAGSIAGAVSGIPGVSSRYDGVARGARIAFTDLGTGRDGSLMTPRDLSSGYFEVAYRAGARIHSDSWGSTSLSYTSSSREIDEFCWARRSFLPVFAAGNYGEYSTGGRTVTAPANAKCALAVGASLTQNGPAPFVDATTFFFRVIGGMPLSGFSEAELYRAMGARFGPDWDDSLGSQERLVVVPAIVLDACVRWDVTTGLPPGSKVVFLVERGTCSFTIKARNAQAAGGVGMMVYNNVEDGYFRMGAAAGENVGDITIPAVALPRSTGLALQAELRQAEAIDSIRINPISLGEAGVQSLPRIESMADFSSVGPTLDGRLKPEITAPGEMISSARSGRDCSIASMSGTSMATPVVSGALAMLRQYFREGWYANAGSKPSSANPTDPSGALLRAVLINGASAMQGYTEAGFPLEPPPSFRQGYGRVNLAGSVMLSTPSSDAPAELRNQLQMALRAADGNEIRAQSQVDKFCFVVERDGPITVTLAWHDPPSLLSSRINLVNDLDLSVQGPGIALPLPGRDDHINNVERIHIPAARAGTYTVLVSATRLPDGPQLYALTSRGSFTSAGVEESLLNFKPGMRCSATTGGDRAVPPTVVSGPANLIGMNEATLRFEPPSGGSIECRLGPQEGAATTPSMHDWRACTSPQVYDNLVDGAYNFEVRDASLIDMMPTSGTTSRAFVVDTSPPSTSFVAPYPFDPKIDERITSLDAIELHFTTSDETATTSECALAYARDSAESLKAAATANVTFLRCASPYRKSGLSEGYHELLVRSTDAAGNVEDPPASYNFRVLFPTPAPSFVGSLAQGVSDNKLSFEFTSDAVATNAATGDGLECRLRAVDSTTPSSWEMPCASPKMYDGLADGRYEMLVRVASPGGGAQTPAASTSFYVDTTPPVVKFTRTPSPFAAGGLMTFHFGLDSMELQPELLYYECSIDPQMTRTKWVPCKTPTTVVNLPSGSYKFHVRGTDAVRNVGSAATWDFVADDTPPSLSMKALASGSTVNLELLIGGADAGGPAVTGSCTLQATRNGRLYGDSLTRNLTLAGVWQDSLSFPSLAEARYLASCVVSDAAGNRATVESSVAVDMSPPTIDVSYAGPAGTMQPSSCMTAGSSQRVDSSMLMPRDRIDFSLSASDATSGVANLQCHLAKRSDGDTSFPAWPEKGAGDASTTCSTGERNDSPLECNAPCRASNLSNGTYWLLATATDAAGVQSSVVACAFQVGTVSSTAENNDGALSKGVQSALDTAKGKGNAITITVSCALVGALILIVGALLWQRYRRSAVPSHREGQGASDNARSFERGLMTGISVELPRVGSSSNNLRQQSSSGRGQPPSRASSALVCSVCGWEAPNPQTLELHLGEHAVLDSTSSPRAGGGFGVGGQTVTFSTHAAGRAQAPPPAAATVPEQSTMKCPICGFGATSIGALNNHIDLAHGTSPDPPSIARRDPSQLPARRSTPPREGVFATQSLPFGHQNELHEASILPRFDDAPRRQQHVPAHASRSINTGGHLVCPICGAHASDMAAMSAHMDAAHS